MISILLATYNSEKYIRAQLDSIINQSYRDWHIVIRDDLSSDGTQDVLIEYVNRYPGKISILDNEGHSKGAYLNFVELLKGVQSDYYMFCDHDDVWLPEKIEVSMNRMKEVEKPGIPVIVHTDMKVVDQDLNLIHNSFWAYSRLLPEHTSFAEMVLCNSANGCTMLFNQTAKEVALPNIKFATMHDMLLNQSVAAKNGIITAVKEPTVLYRQHVDNVVGAQRRDWLFYFNRVTKIRDVINDNIFSYKNANNIKKISVMKYIVVKIKVFFYKITARYE